MDARYEIIIVGAGASGLSAALAAREQGLSHLVLEQRGLGNTVANMPKGKRVFNTPSKMPLRGNLWFGDATREELLEKWQEIVSEQHLNVHENEGVAEIKLIGDGFEVKTASGTYRATYIVLCIGAQGNPRKLGVPGEAESGRVLYRLKDADEFVNRDILIVGGGDSAIEAALALCERNRVTVSYRKGEFFRVKHRNASDIEAKVKEGLVTIHFNSKLLRLGEGEAVLDCVDGEQALPNDVVFALIGSEPPFAFLHKMGVEFEEEDGQKVPKLSEQYETSLPGLYLVGAVTGRPLIKRAINQGYDVVQHIARNLLGDAARAVSQRQAAGAQPLAVVHLNQETCSGCGGCEAVCPEVFKLVDDRSTVADDQVDAFVGHCQVAEQFCPTHSIRVERLRHEEAQAAPGWSERLRSWWRRSAASLRLPGTAGAAANGADATLSTATFDGRTLSELANAVNQIPFFSSLTPQQLLRQIPLFTDLSDDALEEIATGSTLRYFAAETPIVREGEYGETFFVILSGSLYAVGTTPEGLKLFYSTMGRHGFFGEMAALTGFPRSATVTTITDAVVLEIEKYVLIDLMDESRMFKGAVSQVYNERILHTLLNRVPLFRGLNKASLRPLMERFTLRTFQTGAVIVKEGDPGDSLYVIRSGVVKIIKTMGEQERVLAYLRDGTHFGEIALIWDEPRTATVAALTKVEVAQIKRDDFQAMLHEIPMLRERVEQTIAQRLEGQKELEARPEKLERLERLQDVVHTTDVLVIDLDTCIHCDECVTACAAIHDDGVSRLLREGIKIDHYLVATSCKQCEDPLCMIECPVSALGRDENGEVYIKDHCVGCGACARNCPYGNINLYDPAIYTAGASLSGDLWMKFMGVLGSAPAAAGHQDPKAVKCDLCRDFTTPNCVRSCPTGAAMRVNPQHFFLTHR